MVLNPFMAAVGRLRPGVDFSNKNNTLEGIRWDTPGVVPPTREEVEAEIVKLAAEADRIKVSRLRFKLELMERALLAKVDAAVAAAGATAQLYWAEATEIESDHPLVQSIAQALQLSQSTLRAIFEAARDRDA